MSRFRVAVLGADSLVGETLLELLIERRFPALAIHALSASAAPGLTVSAGGEDFDLETVQDFDFGGIDLALLTPGVDPGLATAARWRVLLGATAPAALPRVVPELGDTVLEGLREGGAVACPGALGIALALALVPLRQAAGLERVRVSSYQAASDLDRAGVEELAQQTRELLGFQPVAGKTFARQIAFNCLPQIGPLDAEGHSQEEIRLMTELPALLGLPGLPVSMTAVSVPVFYGHGAAVCIETVDDLDVDAAVALLRAAPGLQWMDATAPDYYPTAVTEASGQDPVFIGRLRRDPAHPQGLMFWLVVDNLRKGSALNAVQIAERWAGLAS